MARTLEAPEGLNEIDDLDEILRVWIGGGNLHLTLHDFFGPDGRQWGWVLADLAMHVARLRLENDDAPVQETLTAIRTGYQERISEQDGLSHQSLAGRN
jgi:hypothetical protein